MELVNAEDLISAIEAWLAIWNSTTEQRIYKICIQNAWEEEILKFRPLFNKKTREENNKTMLVSLFV